MKAFRRVVLLTAVLCLYGFISCLPARAFDTDETYTITVIGGHAETYQGKTLTEAKYGEYIHVYSDVKPGEYVKGWISDSVTLSWISYSHEGFLTTEFEMPQHDVTIVAVYEKQKPYIIDLTKGYQKLVETVSLGGVSVDYNLIDKWICQSIGDGVGGYYSYNVDLDGDGTEDVLLNGSEGQNYPSRFAAIPLYGCSVKGDIVLDKPNAGPYWPITFKFGDLQVKEEYTVTVIGGRETKYEDDRTVLGNEVFTAKAGTYVNVTADSVDGMYVSDWAFDGLDLYSNTYESFASFAMPAKDIIISPKKSPQIPLLIDFSEGYYDAYIGRLDIKYNDTWSKVDIDKDGIYDLCEEAGDRLIPLYRKEPYEFTVSQVKDYMYSPITFKIGELQKDYSIQVNGGHAEDTDGNVITRAASGTTVRVIRDKESGKYWKSWKSDYLDVKFVCFEFIMPARDVTFTAETTSQQLVYDLDLTEEFIELPDEDTLLLLNAIRLFNNQSNYSNYLGDSADFNLDGTIDFEMYYDMNGLNTRRAIDYSLGLSYKVTIDDGQIGTINIILKNEESSHPIVDKSVGKYKIVLKGDVFCEKNDKSYNNTIIEAYPGEYLRVYAGQSVSSGEYCTRCVVDGLLPSYIHYSEDGRFEDLLFYMPYQDVTFTGYNSTQIPFELDLRSGSCIVDFDDGYFPAYLEEISGGECLTADAVEYTFDINLDYMDDLFYNADNHILKVLPNPYTLTSQMIVLNNQPSDHALKYSPLVLILSDEEFYHIDYQVRTEDGISLYDVFSPMTWVDGCMMTNLFDVSEGTIVYFTFDKEKKGYELFEYYYVNAKGEKQSFENYEIEDNGTSYTVIDFFMPPEDISVVGIYRKKNSESPTPTIVPPENVTPSLSPTEPPNDTDKPSSATDSDDFHPFALLIAGLVFCMIGVGLYAVFTLMRKKDKSDTPE